MAKSDSYISFITDELKKGNVKYVKVLEVFLSKFKCTEPTFAKYWKMANEAHTELQEATEREKAISYITKEKEAFEAGLNDKHYHALELQSQIEDLQLLLGDDRGEMTPSDKIRANAEIRAMRKQLGDWYGFNEAEKVQYEILPSVLLNGE